MSLPVCIFTKWADYKQQVHQEFRLYVHHKHELVFVSLGPFSACLPTELPSLSPSLHALCVHERAKCLFPLKEISKRCLRRTEAANKICSLSLSIKALEGLLGDEIIDGSNNMRTQ